VAGFTGNGVYGSYRAVGLDDSWGEALALALRLTRFVPTETAPQTRTANPRKGPITGINRVTVCV
jgi:hypothetical protein